MALHGKSSKTSEKRLMQLLTYEPRLLIISEVRRVTLPIALLFSGPLYIDVARIFDTGALVQGALSYGAPGGPVCRRWGPMSHMLESNW